MYRVLLLSLLIGSNLSYGVAEELGCYDNCKLGENIIGYHYYETPGGITSCRCMIDKESYYDKKTKEAHEERETDIDIIETAIDEETKVMDSENVWFEKLPEVTNPDAGQE